MPALHQWQTAVAFTYICKVGCRAGVLGLGQSWITLLSGFQCREFPSVSASFILFEGFWNTLYPHMSRFSSSQFYRHNLRLCIQITVIFLSFSLGRKNFSEVFTHFLTKLTNIYVYSKWLKTNVDNHRCLGACHHPILSCCFRLICQRKLKRKKINFYDIKFSQVFHTLLNILKG